MRVLGLFSILLKERALNNHIERVIQDKDRTCYYKGILDKMLTHSSNPSAPKLFTLLTHFCIIFMNTFLLE
jgi:hypothetical protein